MNSFPFNSVNGDRKQGAQYWREYFKQFIGNGVFANPSSQLQVISNDDMTVTVSSGNCFIEGCHGQELTGYVLSIDNADGVLKRIDRIVARLDYLNREIVLEVKKGAFASTPVAPDITRDADMYELALADVLVSNGAIKINQADITDLRFDNSLCGIVKGTIEEIDTTDLFAQYQDAFNTWFDDMKDQLNEDAAGNLQLQVDNKVDKGCTWGELTGVS